MSCICVSPNRLWAPLRLGWCDTVLCPHLKAKPKRIRAWAMWANHLGSVQGLRGDKLIIFNPGSFFWQTKALVLQLEHAQDPWMAYQTTVHVASPPFLIVECLSWGPHSLLFLSFPRWCGWCWLWDLTGLRTLLISVWEYSHPGSNSCHPQLLSVISRVESYFLSMKKTNKSKVIWVFAILAFK